MKSTIKHLLVAAVLVLAQLTASAAALTDYGENKIVDSLLRGQAIGTPATWYVALFTTTCTDADREPKYQLLEQPTAASR